MLQSEVKILDLARTKSVWVPRWMVHRSAEILVNNMSQMSGQELRALVDVLLKEAQTRAD